MTTTLPCPAPRPAPPPRREPRAPTRVPQVPLVDVTARRVDREPDLWVWSVFDGADRRLGLHRGDPADAISTWIARHLPGPLVVRTGSGRHLRDRLGPDVVVQDTGRADHGTDRILSGYEQVAVAGLPRLSVATDGSADASWHGSGWVADDGRFSVCASSRCAPVQTNALRGEFAAVVQALDMLHPDRRIELLIDSRTVLADVRRAISGRPVRYGTLLVPRAVARLGTADATASWVKGHDGHRLNEAADRLAKYARRSATAGVQVQESLMSGIVHEELGIEGVLVHQDSLASAATATP